MMKAFGYRSAIVSLLLAASSTILPGCLVESAATDEQEERVGEAELAFGEATCYTSATTAHAVADTDLSCSDSDTKYATFYGRTTCTGAYVLDIDATYYNNSALVSALPANFTSFNQTQCENTVVELRRYRAGQPIASVVAYGEWLPWGTFYDCYLVNSAGTGVAWPDVTTGDRVIVRATVNDIVSPLAVSIYTGVC